LALTRPAHDDPCRRWLAIVVVITDRECGPDGCSRPHRDGYRTGHAMRYAEQTDPVRDLLVVAAVARRDRVTARRGVAVTAESARTRTFDVSCRRRV